ncbi:hypothetical protein DUNSADRAFT_11234 [Dunaliella salina]|uniref:BACK domain-containing protein n=1 Tax=Dunaliella salina TaxID=3046 RepID=A0ABQ7GDU3_DUNSA|nr:hypothetical protein DUNSADRAFT_11234 [Dunaliella salina]|eukprot:KAF5832776.1 hypothetical protein DUNSADRAFT_11234 [Dunaliella salina]
MPFAALWQLPAFLHSQGVQVLAAYESMDGPRKKPRIEIARSQHANAASLPGAVTVPASKVLLSLHSGILRPILAECRNQASLVVPCDDHEHVEAGRLTVEMILDLARPSHLRRHDALFPSLPPSQLIKCIHFAVYWDAQSCVEHCIECLTKMGIACLSMPDVEALLDLPGAVQVIEGQQHKLEELCTRKLMQDFGNVSQVLADDALSRRLCSLSPSALQLLCQCDLGSEEHTLQYLALWFSCARSVQDADGKRLIHFISREDASQLLTLPPERGGISLCRRWLLLNFGNVYCVIKDERFLLPFCSLPFPLVRLWASLDELQVYNENEVAVLLSFWCKESPTTHQQLAELSALLRVGRMSAPFRQLTLPKCFWFTSSILPYFNAAWDDGKTQGFRFGSSDANSVPPAWFAGPRLPAVAECDVLEYSFPKRDVVSMVESAFSGSKESISSPPLYFGGRFWEFRVKMYLPGGFLGIYFGAVRRPSPPLPVPTLAKASYSLSALKPGTGQERVAHGDGKWFKGGARGGRKYLVVDSVEHLDEVCLVDDQLTVSCKLWDIA